MPGFAEMDDQALSQVNAGSFEFMMDDFDVLISNNQAGLFNLDIANSAFNGAQGIFTTLQTVNSAVDLTIIVNIFLNNNQAASQ